MREITTYRPGTPTRAALLLGLFVSAGAFGQDAGELNVDVSQCVGLESEVARFVCYEEAVAAARAQPPSSTAGSARSAASPAAPAAAAPAAAAARSPAPAPVPVPAPEEAEEIFATITDLRETIPDSYVITLDNGQIWQMSQPKNYPLRIGQEARLYPTRWGSSYRLSALERGGHVQVRLVQ